MIALEILALAFCAMALLGLVRLVRELLIEGAFEPPALNCEQPAAHPEPQQDTAHELTSAR